jgi:hypothetical protein
MRITTPRTQHEIDLAQITADDICIEDIAHGLAALACYPSIRHVYYSLAERGIRLASVMIPPVQLQALLLDAEYAYVPRGCWTMHCATASGPPFISDSA